jgi:hypothetical protein
MEVWRHGDVMVARAAGKPVDARRCAHVTLARGEATGHSHRVADPSTATLWQADGDLYLEVVADSATLVHQEHKPIALPHGLYRVWLQREYTRQVPSGALSTEARRVQCPGFLHAWER